MKKMIHKLLLCLTAFTIVFSTFGGAVALASSNTYYNKNKNITSYYGVKIHQNNFPKDKKGKNTTDEIEYKIYVNGRNVGIWQAGHTKVTMFGNAKGSHYTISYNNVKEKGNTVKVTACFRKFKGVCTNEKSAVLYNVTGKQVDKDFFELNVNSKGKAELKRK